MSNYGFKTGRQSLGQIDDEFRIERLERLDRIKNYLKEKEQMNYVRSIGSKNNNVLQEELHRYHATKLIQAKLEMLDKRGNRPEPENPDEQIPEDHIPPAPIGMEEDSVMGLNSMYPKSDKVLTQKFNETI